MKVGLLLCDHVKPQFRDEFGDYPDMFQDAWPGFDFEVYAVCDGQFPSSADDCDAYLVSGSSFSVYDDIDWIEQLKVFVQNIREAEKYYVGVCFGHQLLAEALGGKVLKSENGWAVGVHTFSMLQKEDWMWPARESLNLLMMCQDQVQLLPPNSIILGRTPTCPIGLFRVGNKMLGIQAHPEFSKAYDQTLMENRVDRMGIATVKSGIASLSKPLDADVFTKWVIHFLRGEKYENQG